VARHHHRQHRQHRQHQDRTFPSDPKRVPCTAPPTYSNHIVTYGAVRDVSLSCSSDRCRYPTSICASHSFVRPQKSRQSQRIAQTLRPRLQSHAAALVGKPGGLMDRWTGGKQVASLRGDSCTDVGGGDGGGGGGGGVGGGGDGAVLMVQWRSRPYEAATALRLRYILAARASPAAAACTSLVCAMPLEHG